MAQRKQLTTRPLEQETLLQSVNRELVPYLRQTGQLVEQVAPSAPPIITGSRAGAPVFVMTQLLAILNAAGLIKDNTTP